MLKTVVLKIEQADHTLKNIEVEQVDNAASGSSDALAYDLWIDEQDLGRITFTDSMRSWFYKGALTVSEQQQVASKIANAQVIDPYASVFLPEVSFYVTKAFGKYQLITVIRDGDEYGIRVADELVAVVQLNGDDETLLTVEGQLQPELIAQLSETIKTQFDQSICRLL